MSKRLLVWCFNILVAILCVLSIVCYFFAPVWKVEVTATVKPDMIEKIAPEAVKDGQFEIPVQEGSDPIVIPLTDIIPKTGESISLALNIGFSDLARSFNSYMNKDTTMMEELLNRNVNSVLDQLSGKFGDLTRKVVQTVAKQVVKEEVKSNVKKFLIDNSETGEVSDEEVTKALEDLGFSDDYIDGKMDTLVESFYADGASVDSVTETVMSTVDEVYATFRENAAGKEEYQEFADFEMSEENRAEIEKNVREQLEELTADTNGNINPEDIIFRVMKEALDSAKGGNAEGSENGGEQAPTAKVTVLANVAADAAPSDEAPSDTDPSGSDAQENADVKAELVNTIRDLIMEQLPENILNIMSLVFIGLTALAILSMLPWLYILIKLLVKLLTHGIPTVKLALPIWLGWLFFLLLVGLPNIALLILPKLGFLPAEVKSVLDGLSISITSITWITAVSALICFAISIFYMVMRRKIKREEGFEKHKKRARVDD